MIQSSASFLVDIARLNSEDSILESYLVTIPVAISDKWMRSFQKKTASRTFQILLQRRTSKKFIIPAGLKQFIEKTYFQIEQYEKLILR